MRMLIVDDEPTVLEFFSEAARAKGVEVVDTASSGEDALGKVIGQLYDLITLDISMPGASGLEILSPIRNMCPHAIIAIISGHIPDDFTTEVAGCADLFMRKPFKLRLGGPLRTHVYLWGRLQNISRSSRAGITICEAENLARKNWHSRFRQPGAV